MIDARELVQKLSSLVGNEEWELLDGILDSLDSKVLRDDSGDNAKHAAMIAGIHLGLLANTPMRHRPSFERFLVRFRTAVEASPSFIASELDFDVVLNEMLGGFMPSPERMS